MTSPEPDRAPPSKPFPRSWIVAVVAAAGIAATAFLHARSRETERRRIVADFENAAQNHSAALEKSVELELLLIESLRSWYVAAQGVGRDELRAFVAPILQRGRGVRALEWVPRVTDAERPAYEAAMRRAGAPSYRIRERAGPGPLVPAAGRADYFPSPTSSPAVRAIPRWDSTSPRTPRDARRWNGPGTRAARRHGPGEAPARARARVRVPGLHARLRAGEAGGHPSKTAGAVSAA